MQQERINRNRLFCSVQGVRKDHDTKAHYQSRSILFFFFWQNGLQSEGFHLEQPKRACEVHERISAKPIEPCFLVHLEQGQLPRFFLTDTQPRCTRTTRLSVTKICRSCPDAFLIVCQQPKEKKKERERERRERVLLNVAFAVHMNLVQIAGSFSVTGWSVWLVDT